MANSTVSIVTAFFDIGRGNLPKEKNGRTVPAYQERSTDTYFTYFNNLAKIDNHITVYTTEDLKDKVLELRDKYGKLSKTKVVCLDSFLPSKYAHYKERIEGVMKSSSFISKIENPELIEYWNSDYVLVNALKSYYVNDAIQNGSASGDIVAWIDFGYCRSTETIPFSNEWNYPFDANKIHFFLNKEIDLLRNIEDIIATGDVYVQGCHIVAGSHLWKDLLNLMILNLDTLLEQNLVDDDQTLLLMSYTRSPDLFVLRKNSPTDWFRIFKDYQKDGK